MYIVDDIAYAGNQEPEIKVISVRAMSDHQLWLRFNDNSTRIFDFKPLLSKTVYAPLLDEDVFKSVYIDYGVPVWDDGNIDISPDYLHQESRIESDAIA